MSPNLNEYLIPFFGSDQHINYFLSSIIQLNSNNYAMAVSSLSQIIKVTVNNSARQSSATLARVAAYLRNLSKFVMNSKDLMINTTVSDRTKKYDA